MTIGLQHIEPPGASADVVKRRTCSSPSRTPTSRSPCSIGSCIAGTRRSATYLMQGVSEGPRTVGVDAGDNGSGEHTALRVVSQSARQCDVISNDYSDRATAARLADGYGEAHTYVLEFDPGGAIGQHGAGYGQLDVVLDGRGCVAGHAGERVGVSARDVVLFARGKQHDKGSESGMTAAMVQVRELTPFGDTTPDAQR